MLGFLPGRRVFADRQMRGRQKHFLVRPRRMVIPAKGQPDQKNVEAKKAEDRPRAQRQENRARHKPDADEDTHQDPESSRAKRTVRRQPRVENRFVPVCLVHDLNYSAPMENKKTKIAAGKPKKAMPLYPPEEVREIFRRFAAQRPHPKGELEHVNAFTLLVAVALSAQSTDVGVNKATRALFAIADAPEKMLALGEAGLADYIKTIGLWRNKAKNVIALCKALILDHGSEVPQTREELVKLPGVGRKTANVVLSMAFGQSTMAVDTHIFRLGNRLGLAPGKTPDQVEAGLLAVIPAEYLYHAHHWLILHGRYVCVARKPRCVSCIIADLCRSAEKTNAIPAPLTETQEMPPPTPRKLMP